MELTKEEAAALLCDAMFNGPAEPCNKCILYKGRDEACGHNELIETAAAKLKAYISEKEG